MANLKFEIRLSDDAETRALLRIVEVISDSDQIEAAGGKPLAAPPTQQVRRSEA